MKPVRTRFAPSPTGYLHVGNVRAALFPWLVARQAGGTFVMRIEDTDQAREVEGAVEVIRETLNWLGMDWDEGPDIGGEYGPYTQTERTASYLEWAQVLIDSGRAYADVRTPDELNALREDAKSKKRPFLARDYRPKNPTKWQPGMPLRFLSQPQAYQWHDAIMGDLSAGEDAVDDFILLKSDQLPTYNFAHIIDDNEMQITHVIRGLEYIASMPKYLNLYEALGFEMPVFAHAPHIMNETGNKKLSKRDGAKSILQYRDEGYLPEALLNFLASLGWNDGTTQEIFSREELIEKFDLARVQRAGARFDEQRLLWMNGAWIRALDIESIYARSQAYWPASAASYDDDYKRRVLGLVQERLKYFAELPSLTDFFFAAFMALILTGCSVDNTGSNNGQNQAIKKAQERKNYIPKNDVEGHNYNARQELADNPATIIWCSVYPTNPNVKPFTVPIVGKLTSGNKRPYPTEVTREYTDGGSYYPELPGPDGFYGTSGEYRYGFDPAGNYHDFYNLETYCTSVPNVIQRNTTELAITVSGDLNSLDKQAQLALEVCRAKNPDPSVPCPKAAQILGVK